MTLLVGYPTPGKQKARVILDALAAGCGGKVVDRIPDQLLPGIAAFYGVTPATKHLFDQVLAEKRDFAYIDNAYFDKVRGEYFRVTLNRLQHDGIGKSDGERYRRLGLEGIKPWRRTGEHILICPQSTEFMQVCARYPGDWIEHTMNALRAATKRELRLRVWMRDKKEAYRTLPDALENCWALATYSSASAITAMLSGVPAFCTASDCISRPMVECDLARIETPTYPDGLQAWCEVAADNQWTLREMADGTTWRMMHK